MAQNARRPQNAGRSGRPPQRGRKPTAGKYIVRRLILVLFLLAAVVGGSLYLGYTMARKEVEPSPSPSASSSEPSEGKEEPSSQPSEPEAPDKNKPSEASSEEEEPEPEEVNTAAAEDWELILVNRDHQIDENYKAELEPVVGDFKVDARIREPLLRMIAAAKEDGVTLVVCSAYRPYSRQVELFEQRKSANMARGMTEEEAIQVTAKLTAIPGTSEHQTGLAVDIVDKSYQVLDEGQENTPTFDWMSKNAEKFGFVRRFPRGKTPLTYIDYEAWHYRYVGVENAKIMNEKGYCLEEYVFELNQAVTAQKEKQESENGEDESQESSDGKQ